MEVSFDFGVKRHAMFERYTENARRVIFFARYEASQYGSSCIESEHLLLGLLREDRGLTRSFLCPDSSGESIRKAIEQQITAGRRTSTSVEMPLSAESKRILNLASEEAERLGNKWIDAEHLLLGILRQEKCLAARILQEHGVRPIAVREKLTHHTREPKVPEERQLAPQVFPLRQLIDAWDQRDARKFASFFDDGARFVDAQGNFWIGPVDIEKGAALLFASAEPPTGLGKIEDVHFVRGERPAASVEISWGNDASTPATFRLSLVLSQTEQGWRIANAHATRLQTGSAGS
jgi:uncharacterized protein (TIGR02246 family)